MKSSLSVSAFSLGALTLILIVAGCQSQPADRRSSHVPAPPAGILSVTDVDQPPKLIGTPVNPHYPPLLLRDGKSGNATVRFIVTHDGRVIDVTVVEASHPDFGDAAAAAVVKWRYQPAIKYGQPIACLLMVPIGFSVTEPAIGTDPPKAF
jgi:TonB family protein